MILYVNGDSHSAAAEAVNSFAFAEDDPLYRGLGRIPHPDNERVSYGCLLANAFFAILHCDAESASSNDRIIRTTKEYLEQNKPDAIIIGWSTWEREEWLHDNIYWQINAGGIGYDWPDAVKNKYQEWLATVNLKTKEEEEHEKIWNFHQELKDIPHLFFNTFSSFSYPDPKDWGNSYLSPYKYEYTYYNWLKEQGHQTVNPKSYHYGADAHREWAKFLLPHLTKLI